MTFRLANIDGRASLVHDDHHYDLETVSDGSFGADPMDAIARFRDLHDVAATLADHAPTGTMRDALDAGTVGSPSPRPVNSFGIGLNYADHVAETGREAPEAPVVFAKFPSCIAGPGAAIGLPNDFIDYEAEVVVVIGTGGRNITAAAAWEHVAGVSAGQDISDRALQFAASPPHFDLGKSRDNYGIIGPVLVSVDALDDPDDISVACLVNDAEVQSSSTRHLIFDVPTLVEYLSAVVTLQPGDVIFTGTPSGVGIANDNLLRDGDVVETRVGGVGSMTNPCVAD